MWGWGDDDDDDSGLLAVGCEFCGVYVLRALRFGRGRWGAFKMSVRMGFSESK